MKHLFVAILFCLSFALPVAAQTDLYGGRNDYTCTATGYFRMTLFSNGYHWLCTPLGHGLFSIQLDDMNSVFVSTGTISAHYLGYAGLTYPQTWGQGLKDQVFAWNFNSSGYLPDGQFSNILSPGDPAAKGLMPFQWSWEFAQYALRNLCTTLGEPIKSAMSEHGIGGKAGTFVDVYDANWTTALSDIITHRGDAACNNISGYPSSFTTNPYMIVESFGESDPWTGIGNPVTQVQSAWFILASELVKTGGTAGPYNVNQIYTRTTNYSKQAFIDYLTTLYGTIGALNTAWTSTYTRFATTGTAVSGESFGTGNGVTLVFSHTLAHTPVDTASLSILVGGTLRLGDLGNGTLVSSQPGGSIASGTVNYTTGAVSITFTGGNAPGNGVAITDNYNYNGYCHGTGLADECGVSGWMGDPNTLVGETPSMQTDMNTFFSALLSKMWKTQHDAIRVFDANHLIGSLISPVNESRSQVLTSAATGCSGGPCLDLWLAIAHKNTGVVADTLQPLATFYNQTNIPIIAQSPAFFAEADSAQGGLPTNGPDCINRTTQALRGADYKQYLTNALALTATDGTHPIAGFEYGYWVDINASFCNISGVENFGLMTPTLNTYNGVEPAAGGVSCSAPIGTQACGSEPAPAGSGVRPFGNFIGNATTGVTGGNALWLAIPASPGTTISPNVKVTSGVTIK